MKFKSIFAGMVSAVFLLSGCSGNTDTDSEQTSSETESQTLSASENASQDSSNVAQVTELTEEEKKLIANSDVLPQLEQSVEGEILAVMKTNKGDISLRLFPDKAPKAVENFVTHAKEGYYNGVIFHRVINNFMIQGGDPTGTGRGGESIWKQDFENEISTSMRSFRGALCMANAGPDTNGSQFYIVQCPQIHDSEKQQFEYYRQNQDEYLSPQSALKVKDFYPPKVIDEYINNGGYPSLDGSYTVFGQVSSGMDVVDAIAAVETTGEKPNEDIIINSIEIK